MACFIAGSEITDLEHFKQSSRVLVKQKSSGFNGNKYQVLTLEGQLLFTLREDSNALQFIAGGHDRGFHMSAYDSRVEKVFSLRRPRTLGADKVEVSMGGVVVGVVRREVTLIKPVFSINSPSDRPMYRVKGDFMQQEFTIRTPSKTVVGSINKDFAGVAKELLTSRDNYCISFPKDMSVQYKAVVIATCVLIDYKYHEG